MALVPLQASALSRWWDRTRSRLRGVRVIALVGQSGTGKSFRAALIADRYDLQAIIDDGLLIADGEILAGHSAKREEHFLAATKTACFFDPAHRRAVHEAIVRRGLRRILVLGTSDRMIERNCRALGLPLPWRTVRIEDIATRDEIEAATRDRRMHGRHVIPLPIIEVRRSYPRMLAESITVWLRRGRNLLGSQRAVQKTLVRPRFSAKGGVTISEAVLGQMVLHCIDEKEPDLTVSRIRVRHVPSGYRLKVVLAVPLGRELLSSLHQLHEMIVTEIEAYTGIWIDQLSLSIEEIEPCRDTVGIHGT